MRECTARRTHVILVQFTAAGVIEEQGVPCDLVVLLRLVVHLRRRCENAVSTENVAEVFA